LLRRPGPGSEPVPAGDIASFAATVQPVVTDSCASLDCHGAPGRPLRLYAERGLRHTAALRDTPITDAEVADNVAAFIGVSPGEVVDHLALRKPLAIGAGGMEHIGGDLWSSTADPSYAALRAWLASVR
jgi:hypothetical protein